MCSAHGVNLNQDPQDILIDNEVEMCYQMTQDAYEQACGQVGYTVKDVKVQHILGKMSSEDYNDKLEKLDQVYRGLICNFPTDMLIAILESHERKQNGQDGVSRAQKTLDSIHTELLERELNEEKGYT